MFERVSALYMLQSEEVLTIFLHMDDQTSLTRYQEDKLWSRFWVVGLVPWFPGLGDRLGLQAQFVSSVCSNSSWFMFLS